MPEAEGNLEGNLEGNPVRKSSRLGVWIFEREAAWESVCVCVCKREKERERERKLAGPFLYFCFDVTATPAYELPNLLNSTAPLLPIVTTRDFKIEKEGSIVEPNNGGGWYP